MKTALLPTTALTGIAALSIGLCATAQAENGRRGGGRGGGNGWGNINNWAGALSFSDNPPVYVYTPYLYGANGGPYWGGYYGSGYWGVWYYCGRYYGGRRFVRVHYVNAPCK